MRLKSATTLVAAAAVGLLAGTPAALAAPASSASFTPENCEGTGGFFTTGSTVPGTYMVRVEDRPGVVFSRTFTPEQADQIPGAKFHLPGDTHAAGADNVRVVFERLRPGITDPEWLDSARAVMPQGCPSRPTPPSPV